MADTPVDNVDTSVTEAAPAETPAAEAGDSAAPEKKAAPKKKAAAKKAPAKKAAAKKAPAKKAAAKKTTAAKTAAAKTSAGETEPTDPVEAAEAPEAGASPAEEVAAATDDADGSAPAVLFKAPEVTSAPKKPKAKAAAKPKDDDAEDRVGERTRAKKDDDRADDAENPDEEAADESAEESDEDSTEGEGGTSSAARRRRRRGGRRRRKPGGSGGGGANADDDGEQSGDDDATSDPEAGPKSEAKSGPKSGSKSGTKAGSKSGTKAEADSGDDDANDTEDDTDGGEQGEGGGSSSSSRRRRRRRREGEGGDNGDDPNTVVRVRKPRSPEDEITAVSGSTRLEAKKQRRREGREAGRRRAPIVSEAEFLARRESVERVMVVRQRKDLTQIAVLEDKVLVEHYVARESQTSLIGNVYLGRVQNVLPSMEAAFIDIGRGRNAVLYAGEVNWSALGHQDGTPRKIESVLQSGQSVLVQVTKDPVGHKGARLTSQVSLAGRFLVYVPDGTTSGISRKLPDTERGRLKALLKEIVPDTAGVIVRTAAEGASEDELTRDVERLKARWEDVEAKAAKGNAPQLLYGEPDLTLKVVRDLFTEDFAKLVIQGDDAWETVSDYVEHVAPDLADRLEHYQADGEPGQGSKPDAFAAYRIDEQIAKGLDRKVWLPSGGSLVIDRTEAMTVVDVNTGKFTGSGGNLEETVTKNNLEAAEEIVRQLRLRDIGGIIVVDFIDMVLESNRDLVLRRLVECLGRDRTRHQVAEVTSLGLVQMTRKRIGTGLLEAFSETCDHCQGRGIVVHDLPVEQRRGGGDDEARRGNRRRRGKNGGGQGEEPAAKAVPSPKDIAAMAKPPAPEADEADEADEATEADPVVADEVVAATPQPEPVEHDEQVEQDEQVDTAAAGATAKDAVAVEETPSETAEAETPEAETPEAETPEAETPEAETPEAETPELASQPVPEPVEPAAPKVVTRTRRRAASRPAGPPVSASAAEPAAETGNGAERLIGDIGAPVAHGAVEPNEVAVEPGVEPLPPVEEPHVEHVPIKRKGTRKR